MALGYDQAMSLYGTYIRIYGILLSNFNIHYALQRLFLFREKIGLWLHEKSIAGLFSSQSISKIRGRLKQSDDDAAKSRAITAQKIKNEKPQSAWS
jgi:hypothetical protein